jgi:hypothetical protein
VSDDPHPGDRFMWGKDEVAVVAVLRGTGEAIKFRRLRDGQLLQCGLSYFLRMSDPQVQP